MKNNQTGLIVTVTTPTDTNFLQEVIDDSDFYGEFNEREGFWFFPEEMDCYDPLEVALTELFDFAGINVRIEGVWS